MCGRFYTDNEIAADILRRAGRTADNLELPNTGDIYPSQQALILSGRDTNFYAETMPWGFPRFDGKGLLINARAETAAEKKTFKDSVLHRRCLIPARHFYEWDQKKNKIAFRYADQHTIFMAGFYRQFAEEDRFIIVTTSANDSMRPVHDRMPLILPEEHLATGSTIRTQLWKCWHSPLHCSRDFRKRNNRFCRLHSCYISKFCIAFLSLNI